MCSAFGGYPQAGGALDQNPTLVHAIFDYRNAREAIRLTNDLQHDTKGDRMAAALREHPDLFNLMLEIVRAQQDGYMTDEER